jgi:DNA-binding LacI/PurR family transcriptional regulator
LQRAAIDAIVTCSASSDHPATELLNQRGVRVVGAQRSEEGDWVAINDVKAGRLIGKHLAKLGHHRLVVVVPGEMPDGVPFEVSRENLLETSGRFAVERMQGMSEKLPDASIRLVCGGWNTKQAGKTAAAFALDVQHRPTAIVALSDVMAVGVWEAARERGLKPGRDLSISGFDGVPDSEFLGITTVSQPIEDKGRYAGRLAMDPDYPQRQILLPVELIVRASTGPAPRV